jgi:ankyrin repeat protein
MAAAGKGRLDEASFLMSAGADPLLKARDGSTARDWAAKFGHAEVADFLDAHMQVGPCQV